MEFRDTEGETDTRLGAEGLCQRARPLIAGCLNNARQAAAARAQYDYPAAIVERYKRVVSRVGACDEFKEITNVQSELFFRRAIAAGWCCGGERR
ncbi:MAG: hypothetical protein CVT78_00360 [Alphaproteobacteria bacterium HGW-Alphaproteobacteria-17]|nr:MAG: hypothetical protein CVT78_00360 [Alphaproteobacteria bacterium HGW-Alphaproteobacteria-17]